MLFPLFSNAQGTRAYIDKKGDIWTIHKGSSHGVKVGMEGYVIKEKYDEQSKKTQYLKVARFKVTLVYEVASRAMVDNWEQGYGPKDAQWAEFIDKLATTAGKKKKAAPPKKEVTVEAGKDRRWYLDQGDKEFEQANYEGALKYYQKVLEKDANDPGAVSREKLAKGKFYSQQGNVEYENESYAAALEYYLMAFLHLGEKDRELAEKILNLWDTNDTFYTKIQDFKVNPDAILETVIQYCENLLKEGNIEKLPDLLAKLKKHVKDEKLKLAIDDIDISLEIHQDITAKNFGAILDVIDASLNENNLYKANFIAKKLENLEMDENSANRLSLIKEKLAAKQDQIEIQKQSLLKEERIKNLEKDAQNYVNLKEFDKAIESYIKIMQLEPDKPQYGKKLKDLQMKKFQYEKSQEEIKAKLQRDTFLLQAKDNKEKDLIQDALDYYIKAYMEFPEDGKAMADMVKILETCGPEDAAYITGGLLERKFSKFKKDFLGHIEKNYQGKNDETGLKILTKIIFLTGNKKYDDLIAKFKSNLYQKNLQLGDTAFSQVDFNGALTSYQTAKGFMETPDIGKSIAVTQKLIEIQGLTDAGKKKDAANAIKTLPFENRTRLIKGLVLLSKHYMKKGDFERAKHISKPLISAHKQNPNYKPMIEDLKKAEKEFKK
jgi:hypothetical protein